MDIIDIVLRLGAALVVGGALGLNRELHGKPTGLRTLSLVALGSALAVLAVTRSGDINAISRVVQGTLTGIGFLGAGIIVKSGTSVRGLTTAASIWSSSAIGILVGVGFFTLAIGLTVLFALCMIVIPRIERSLPAHSAMAATLRYAEGKRPREEEVLAYLKERQLQMVPDSLSVSFDGKSFELRFAVFADSSSRSRSISRMARDLAQIPEVAGFNLEQTSRA